MFYEKILRPLLFRADPEKIHDRLVTLLASTPVSAFAPERRIFSMGGFEKIGLRFRNPVGLAAGFDKNAAALPAWYHLGFGFCEIGTVTPRPQTGNPKPRIRRIPEEKALVNRMGFPNVGAREVRRRLERFRDKMKRTDFSIGVNIGKNRDTAIEKSGQDYGACVEILGEVADFFVLNLSSPNTPDLRRLQGTEYLEGILGTVQERNRRGEEKPILLKISPDETEERYEEIAEVIRKFGLGGAVATNTTVFCPNEWKIQGGGGMSGAPLRERSGRVARRMRDLLGEDFLVIGVGGVLSGEDARARRNAGADLIELYSGLVYRGPGLVRECLEALS